MPELPEVETVRQGLADVLEGRRLHRVQAMRPDLRFPLPENFEGRLSGRQVEKLARRGKYLLIHLQERLTLIAHLGMSGRFRIFNTSPPPLERHDHVVFEAEGGISVRFNDPRRFGFMDLADTDTLAGHKMLKNMGPEPLANDFNGPVLAAALKGRKSPIKAALLDQSVIAGMGNIYVSEALFRAGLSPKRKSGTVQGGRAENLARAIRDVLNEAIAAGGSSLRDHRQPSGELGYFQHSFAVYGCTGQPCPGCTCDPTRTGGIRRITQSGRSTFYCAAKQR
ncbi:MAG TPA: bifunctional DNA-formamidopyrimidine glycosylase/DNA-(apurinic or apyrimidinic site) lyase [Rhodospirillales bacterium]|jgi:formamidopyrimidine-DNA glycosylase|nr:MAG: Formamidopyrimidine-DNA glycosylase [Alphaproteobacteria bacterium MarineAlpha3_Bin1]PPR74431.1 MAG: Formamidopyrimidine-DNA glycosylase [Alphaproteobacteria bacterium MarineAlpha3_Bin2]HIM76832.1 bifunctional DNA-formamidopyrimidine glycosylase/DNA-(apurinic or apyrimidinic site) lyase [Rhodospirillales bacterium]